MLLSLLATGVTIDLEQQAIDQGLSAAATPAAFGNFISLILSAVFVIAGLMLLLFLVWGAIDWITGGGEKGKIEAARNKMTNAVIGIIVLASTLVLFILVQRFLGVEIIKFNVEGESYQPGRGPNSKQPLPNIQQVPTNL